MKAQFFLLFLKEHDLRPCSNSRSRDSPPVQQIESSVRPNLTDLVTKQGFSPQTMKIQLFPFIFLQKQALKPCSNSRSRDSLKVRQIESSVRPKLIDLATKQGFTFKSMKMQLVPFIFKRAGPETMPKL